MVLLPHWGYTNCYKITNQILNRSISFFSYIIVALLNGYIKWLFSNWRVFAEEDDDDPVLAAALEDDTNLEDEQMAKLMGFSNFDSTKVWIYYMNCMTGVIRYLGASETRIVSERERSFGVS